MTNTIIAGSLIAVAGYAYLAWILFSVWRARRWPLSAEKERPDEEFARKQEPGFETYGQEECYEYCRDHPVLGDADAWLPCEQVCRV